jgi:magnesium chelatase accessory protein
LEIPDGRIRVRILGRGEPVLCLHGLSAHGRTWLAVAERLADRCTLWVPDLLSRGQSTARPDVSYGLEDEVRRVIELIGELGASPRVVAGHSQGAAIALGLATRDPRIRGLVLCSPVTPWTRRPLTLELLRSALMRRIGAGIFRPLRRPLARVILARAFGPAARPSAATVRAYSAPYGEPERARALMRLLADWRPDQIERWLPDRELVASVMVGEQDPRITTEAAERVAEYLRAPLRRVPHGGHVLPEQVPELVASEIAAVLDSAKSTESMKPMVDGRD